MYTYIHTPAHKYIPESLCHMPETLQTSYNHKNLKKKKKEKCFKYKRKTETNFNFSFKNIGLALEELY